MPHEKASFGSFPKISRKHFVIQGNKISMGLDPWYWAVDFIYPVVP